MADSPLPDKPTRREDTIIEDKYDEALLTEKSDMQPISDTNSGAEYTRDFESEHEEPCTEEDGFMSSVYRQIVDTLFDDTWDLERYATFKSATTGFLLLTLFTQNCTQLRLLVLAKNHTDYAEHIHLWRALIFFMSVVIILLVIAAVLLFFISLLPLTQHSGQNKRILTRLVTILAVLISVTCLLNVFCTTLIFAGSKDAIYLNDENNDDEISIDDDSNDLDDSIDD